MSQPNTANLLRRKKLKGDELGRALLLSFVHDFRQRNADQSTPLFTQAQLQQLVARLPSEYERDIYQQYAAIYEQVVGLFQQAQGMLQQLLHGLYRLTTRVALAEKVLLLQRRVRKLTGLDGDPTLPEDIHTLFPEDFEGILSNPTLQAELHSARNLLVLPSYADLIAYNAMLETLGKGLSVPELRELATPLESVRADGDAYDAMLRRCYDALPNAESAAFRALCGPLALSDIQPDPEAQARFIQQLQDTGPDPEQLVRALRPQWEEAEHA